MMTPFTRVVPGAGSSVEARSLSSFQHGSGTCSHLYSHHAHVGLYPPTVASPHQGLCVPQAPASVKL